MFSFEELRSADTSLEFEPIDIGGDQGVLLHKNAIVGVARRMKEEFGFLQLIDAFGIDRMERKNRFEVTYNIRNHKTNQRVFLKVRCDERDPHVPSLCGIWSGCNWNEREAYDMYGILFDGHPDMRRMYMPQEYEHWPLRKDFPLLGIPGSIPLPHHEDSDPRFNLADRGE